MGDIRFEHVYERLAARDDAKQLIASLSDVEVIAALAAASSHNDPYVANVLATEAMNRAEAKEVAFARAAEAIVQLDEGGIVRAANPAASGLFGVDAEWLRGRRLADVVHPCDPVGTCPLLAPVVAGVAHEGFNVTMQRADGTQFGACFAVSPIRRDGESTGAIVTFRDATACPYVLATEGKTAGRIHVNPAHVDASAITHPPS